MRTPLDIPSNDEAGFFAYRSITPSMRGLLSIMLYASFIWNYYSSFQSFESQTRHYYLGQRNANFHSNKSSRQLQNEGLQKKSNTKNSVDTRA